MKTLSIDAYQLGEFSQKVQDAILDGYVFDFDSNENYPTSFGSFYHAVLVKKDSEAVKVVVETLPDLQEEVKKPGRKAKSE